MPIVFTDHAKKQLKERHILQKSVTQAVTNPDRILKSFKNRRLRQKVFGGKILEAVTVTEGSKITIITAYYLKEK